MVVEKELVEWWRVGVVFGVFSSRDFPERGTLSSLQLDEIQRLNHVAWHHEVLDNGEDVSAIRLIRASEFG